MSSQNKKKGNYKPGDMFAARIPTNIDEKTLNWINNQDNISKAVLELTRKYANNELVPVEIINNILTLTNTHMKHNHIQHHGQIDVNTEEHKNQNGNQHIKEKTVTNAGSDNSQGNISEERTMDDKKDAEKQKNTVNMPDKNRVKKQEGVVRVPNRRLPFQPARINK